MFELGYATTVYKYQGSTIEGDYNVYDVDRMDANELYTALTRARKSAQVHLNYCTKKFRFAQEPPSTTKINLQPCETGHIYYMWNDESKKGYVGLTEHTVEKRVQEHKDWKDDPIHKHPGEWYHKAVVA